MRNKSDLFLSDFLVQLVVFDGRETEQEPEDYK